MKTYLGLSILLFLPISSIGQSKIDSLKDLMHVAEQEGKDQKVCSYLSHIGWHFLAARQYDSALSYYYKSLAMHPVDEDLAASTLDCMGVVYSYKGFLDSSVYYYNRSLVIYLQRKDTANINTTENNLSMIYEDIGLYDKALESAFNVLARLNLQKPDRTLASSYNTIGTVYKRIGEYDDALIYYNKSLNVRREIAYTGGIGQSYNNIGEMYIAMRRYDSALSNLKRAEKIKRDAADQKGLSTTLNNIGEVYLAQNDVTSAQSYFAEALQIKKNVGERLGEIIVLNNLGKLCTERKDFAGAERYLNEAENLTHQVGSLEQLAANLTLKINLYKASSNFPKAFRYAEELFVIKDSVLNQNKAKNLIAIGILYETERKEKQIDLLQRQKAVQELEINSKKNWIQSLIVIVCLITIIGILLLYFYRTSQKNKRKVENLLKELHHRVKNNLQILSSVLSLQSNQLTDQTAIEAVKSSEGRVNAMALIHRKLYTGNESRAVDLKGYITELLEYLMHSYGYNKNKLNLVIDMNPLIIDVDKAIPIGLVLNELISNSFKHAYTNVEHPELIIAAKTLMNNQIQIVLQDNGKGFTPQNSDETKSFGLKMTKTLITELRGKIDVTIDHGTKYTINITTL